jgi:hypothetical protein
LSLVDLRRCPKRVTCLSYKLFSHASIRLKVYLLLHSILAIKNNKQGRQEFPSIPGERWDPKKSAGNQNSTLYHASLFHYGQINNVFVFYLLGRPSTDPNEPGRNVLRDPDGLASTFTPGTINRPASCSMMFAVLP